MNFLKLDCEGSEYAILYSASGEVLNGIDTIAIETHAGSKARQNMKSLLAFLNKNGFNTNSHGDIIWAWK
ncbi:MAG TPA: hypothetical protein ENH02_01285 [Bacteroidetes bacterium]|nr:hypothetical protein [Bacteroidota bacterium]